LFTFPWLRLFYRHNSSEDHDCETQNCGDFNKHRQRHHKYLPPDKTSRASLAGTSCFLYPALRYQFGKIFKRPVVGFFRVLRKAAGGQLPLLQVIRQAVTTGPLSAAGLIGAIAIIEIFFFFTFH
jgi:hypothetical protein